MYHKLFYCDVGGNSAYVPMRCCLGREIANLIGAGVSAIGGIASSAMSQAASEKIARENREWQEKMWNKNNAYNAPSAQRERLEAAGINPALAFQSGNTGVASSAPNAPNAPMPDFSSFGAGLSNAAAQVLQGRQIEAQNELLKEQAAAQRIDNQYKALEAVASINEKIENAKKHGAETTWLEWQRDRSMALYDYERKNMYNNILEVQARTRLENANAYISEIDGLFRRVQNTLGIRLDSARIAEVRQAINESVAREGVLTEEKAYHILDNARILPEVEKAVRLWKRQKDNPTETDILDALGLWLDPVTGAIDAGTKVSNARNYGKSVNYSKPQPRAKLKRSVSSGNKKHRVTEYEYGE